MKINWNKVALALGALLLFGLVIFLVKMQMDAKTKQEALNQQIIEMKQLQDGIVRNQSKYVSKEDLDKFGKDMDLNLNAIRKDLKEFGAEVKGISTILAKSVGYKGNNLPSSGTNPKAPTDPETGPTCPDGESCPDPYGYMSSEQLFSLHESFSDGSEIPFGSVGFSAWKEKPWSADILPREYRVSTVLAQDEDGKHYVYNKMQIDVNGEKHNVPISQAEYQETYPEAKFRFDPHIALGVDVGASITTSPKPNEAIATADVVPNLQVTLFSYDQTKKNPEWTFLGVGLGYESQRNSLGILLSPVNYNVGKHIPLMDNFYLGPVVGVDIKGNVLVGGGIRVGL